MTAAFNDMHHSMTLAPVIPVITIADPSKAVNLAKALVAGGLPVLEVTLRTPDALQAIENIAKAVPDAVVGAGTVITPKQVDQVAAAGGVFCISPGSTPALLKRARDAGMKFLPGAVTSSEVMNLLDQDITYMKFFPAVASGGVPVLKSIGGPLPEAKFCPTGGVKPNNVADFLALDNVLCVGGTWVSPADAIANNEWDRITALAREAANIQ